MGVNCCKASGNQTFSDPPLQPMLKETVYGITFEIMKGDITLEVAEKGAIVNAANTELIHQNGLAGSILAKGGDIIQTESRTHIEQNGNLKSGDVISTSGGALKVKYVIHAVVPMYTEGATQELERLERCIKGSLQKATDLHLVSIAFPALSSGVFGFPPLLGADTMIKACFEFAREQQNKGTIRLIKFINQSQEMCTAFKSEFQKHLGFVKSEKSVSGKNSAKLSVASHHESESKDLVDDRPLSAKKVEPGMLHLQNANIDLTVSQFVEVTAPSRRFNNGEAADNSTATQ